MTLHINQKLFQLDKNYILKEAQATLEPALLAYMVTYAKDAYLTYFNPLGLEDDTVLAIKAAETPNTTHLEELYANLAAIYRYKFGETQLELLFDGSDHLTKYKEDWEHAFKHWLSGFCLNLNFLKAILEATVFFPEDRKATLACNRLKAFINHHFELKVYRYRGIIEMRIA